MKRNKPEKDVSNLVVKAHAAAIIHNNNESLNDSYRQRSDETHTLIIILGEGKVISEPR